MGKHSGYVGGSRVFWRFVIGAGLLVAPLLPSRAIAQDTPVPKGPPAVATLEVSPPTRDAAGVWNHKLRSPRQSGETELRVLLPPDLAAAWQADRSSAPRVPVVFLLPVEANRESRYGDPIREVLERKLHQRFRVVFAAPTFARLPWYADHPQRADSRQETYFLEDVVPFVEARYPVRAERAGRFLLGFSKSGWGAWALLLLHPDRFERATAWDAPLMMNRPGLYGSGDIFGDDATFRRYEISTLLRQQAGQLRGATPPRLVLTGYGNFRGEHERTHQLLDELSVPHAYRDGPMRVHDWHSGWVAESLELLLPEHGKSESADSPASSSKENEPPLDIDRDLAMLAAAGPNSKGSRNAQAAADRLRHLGPELLPRLLRVMDDSNAVGANWARTVFEDIAERSFAQPVGGKLAIEWPMAALQSHVRDRTRSGKSRRLALRLVERLDPTFAAPWLLTCLDDPEFRADAVDATLRAGDAAAKGGDRDAARKLFQSAFGHARDSDQVLLAARKLSETGEAVDPIRHLGFVNRWYLVGPFDAPGTSGFDAKFPPQDPTFRFDPLAKFPGTSPANNPWKIHETRDRLGQVDLIQALAAAREAVGYAYAEFDTPVARPAQLRCSADDNLTVWLNGQEVLARRQWLNGTRLDRFSAPVKLESGINRLLVKICQGPQHADPAVPNNWSFQVRLCDDTGAGVPFIVRSPAPAPAPAPATSSAGGSR